MGLQRPRFISENWEYWHEEFQEYRLKEDAPPDIIEEYNEFKKIISYEADDNGLITQY